MVIFAFLLLQSVAAQFYDYVSPTNVPKLFYFDGDLRANQPEAYANLQKVFQYVSDRTCIRFQEVDKQNANSKITDGGNRYCQATASELWLGTKCGGAQVTLHEVHHWLGMFHTQNRSDRDDFLSFKGNATIPDKWMHSVNVVPFDYGSCLIYSPMWECNKTTDLCDMYEVKDFKYYYTSRLMYIEQFYDIYALNLFYCNETCSGEASPNCQNGGYPNPSKCSECLCPRGFAGLDCTQPAGGKVFVAKEEFQKELITRNGDYKIDTVQLFDWIIAPVGKHIEYRLSQTGGFEWALNDWNTHDHVEVFASPDIRQSPYIHNGDKKRYQLYQTQTPGDEERAHKATKSGIYAGNVLRVSVHSIPKPDPDRCPMRICPKYESFIEFRYVDGDHTNNYVLSNVSAMLAPPSSSTTAPTTTSTTPATSPTSTAATEATPVDITVTSVTEKTEPTVETSRATTSSTARTEETEETTTAETAASTKKSCVRKTDVGVQKRSNHPEYNGADGAVFRRTIREIRKEYFEEPYGKFGKR